VLAELDAVEEADCWLPGGRLHSSAVLTWRWRSNLHW
jgi:hypothetical protein